MVMASSVVSKLESKGLNDSREVSNLVVNDLKYSGDAVFHGGTVGALSTQNQLSNQSEQISISSYYENSTAKSGDILTWGVQSSWNGTDFSELGNFASDKSLAASAIAFLPPGERSSLTTCGKSISTTCVK